MFEKALKILRLNRGADKDEVRKAYVKMSRRYPPEHFPNKFKQIKDAYDQLNLNWRLVEYKAKELINSKDREELMQKIAEESLELAEEGQEENLLEELDIWSLEPIVNALYYKERVKDILGEIPLEDNS